MDNHHLILKVSRLLPSSLTSCHFRTLPDVAENKIPRENDLSHSLSSSFAKPKKFLPKICQTKGPKCPPKFNPLISASSSNTAWFTSADDLDTDTFFSISSNSGDSFRLKTARIRQEMKSIDETGRRSAAKGERKSVKTWPEIDLGSDQIFTRMYYEASVRRRKKSRKAKKRSLDCRSVIGESYAVEKRSSDPGGDFRASMVEMILEKRIFAAEDLERLLRCFLSLNSVSYHGIIFQVFSEICHTLFRN